MHVRPLAATALIAVAALTLSACSGSEPESTPTADTRPLVMWTLEGNADRIVKQEAMLAEYTKDSGVDVELVPVEEDQLSTALTAAAAGGTLPDLIGALPLANVLQFASDDIIDADATAEVLDTLGRDTFDPQILKLTEVDGKQLSVPSDAFPLLVYYRTDLFDAAGLDAPTDYASITAAAKALNAPGMAGIVAATSASELFTSQTIEFLSQANGCELIDDSGDIQLQSDECLGAFDFYTSLMRDYSTVGEQDTTTTRATYFAGQAAMVVWSSFLLDELAGLRNNALPTCAECTANPQWLAENTGVVGSIEGPDGSSPAGYGEVVSFTIMRDAHSATKDLATWLMSDGYLDWIGIAPEGKIPTRAGTTDDPTAFADAWAYLETGVDSRATLASLYGPEVLDTVNETLSRLQRWGVLQGQGTFAGAFTAQRVLPTVLSDVIASGGSVEDAARTATEQAEQIKLGIG